MYAGDLAGDGASNDMMVKCMRYGMLLQENMSRPAERGEQEEEGGKRKGKRRGGGSGRKGKEG